MGLIFLILCGFSKKIHFWTPFKIQWAPKWVHKTTTRQQKRQLLIFTHSIYSVLRFGCILVAFWFLFGTLLVPFGALVRGKEEWVYIDIYIYISIYIYTIYTNVYIHLHTRVDFPNKCFSFWQCIIYLHIYIHIIYIYMYLYSITHISIYIPRAAPPPPRRWGQSQLDEAPRSDRTARAGAERQLERCPSNNCVSFVWDMLICIRYIYIHINI